MLLAPRLRRHQPGDRGLRLLLELLDPGLRGNQTRSSGLHLLPQLLRCSLRDFGFAARLIYLRLQRRDLLRLRLLGLAQGLQFLPQGGLLPGHLGLGFSALSASGFHALLRRC